MSDPSSGPTPLSTFHTTTAGVDSAAAAEVRRYPLVFTGQGGEYFRIWIVNLLLIAITLGFYTPWAKVRKLKYFYGHTLLAGHALDFHGAPKSMLRGYLLVGVLLTLYSMAGEAGATSGSIAGLILACIWPALYRASMQFRLANTSWRGLRFRFTGDRWGIYKVFALPIVALALIALSSAWLDPSPQDSARDAARVGQFFLAATLLLSSTLPYMLYAMKRYQHNHYEFGQLRTQLRLSAVEVYKLCGKTLAIVLLAIGLPVAIGIALSLTAIHDSRDLRAIGAFFGLFAGAAIAYGLLLVVAYPYFTARLQNMVWTNTGSSLLRFKSHLAFRPLMALTFKNFLLTLLTLGFYWPFAAVAMARIKVCAVTVHTRIDIDDLIDSAPERKRGDAAGDAAADLMGVDFGL